jgi:tetratricopeptide (TPR) repeat protein
MTRLFTLLLTALLVVTGGALRSADTIDDQIHQAFEHAYNLDHDQALAAARRIVAAAPNESRAHRTLATMIWLDLLFKRGAVTVDHYLGGVTKSQLSLPKPPPQQDAEFKTTIARALTLADQRRSNNDDDMAALHDWGSAQALQASYTASIDGSITAAFSAARRAFHAEEEVLERDPRQSHAATVVGTYRYAVSSLRLPTRMIAYVMGMGGDRERAIRLLEQAAGDPRTRVEALTALVLIHSREGKHGEAQRLLSTLSAAYPRNRVFRLEQASAAIRGGRAADADALITRGLADLERDSRPTFPGERALWLYKRGLARLTLGRSEAAAADLSAALASAPADWTRARVHLAQGKLADLAGHRSQAEAQYRLARDLGRSARDPICANEAVRLLEKPFRMPAG